MKDTAAMKVALTGGIGSGKSYVCRLLERRGIYVYDCDAAAKRLIRHSEELKKALQSLVGEKLYADNQFQKHILAEYILKDDTHAQRVNAIVHPAVAADFNNSGYRWLESAIFFDSGFDSRVYIDKVVAVVAPEELRLDRIMARDGIARLKALEWIHRQLPQDEVVRRSDFVIHNDGSDLDEQIDHCLSVLGIATPATETEFHKDDL